MLLISQPISIFAATIAGATTIFRSHGIDFCCEGAQTLRDAAHARGLDPDTLLRELMENADAAEAPPASLANHTLITLIQDRYHAAHRRALEELLYLSRTVESVHGQHPECPKGLNALLVQVASELEDHMCKEEQILFPTMLSGEPLYLAGPIACMLEEHGVFGSQLHQMASLTRDFTPPVRACATWRALYTTLRHFTQEAEEHVHLENNVLFPRFVHMD